METTTATQAVDASCDARTSHIPEWENTNAPCALSGSPCGSSECATCVALFPCGLFDSCCGVRHVRRSASTRGPSYHPATASTTLLHVSMVSNALRAALTRGGRDGEHARAAVVDAGGKQAAIARAHSQHRGPSPPQQKEQ